MRALLLAVLLLPLSLQAQEDERRVASPNGRLEFRLFVAQPNGALFSRIGYQVFLHGKPLIATSWMGLDIRDQEPFLGENPGFMSSDTASGDHYNSLVARYMQNGSLGRRLDVEIRAYDEGVAFRYVIPRSTPLEDLLIRDEATEFNFAQPGILSHLAPKPDFDLPFEVPLSGADWVAIAESTSSTYPPTYLVRTETGMKTSLARSKTEPSVAFVGKTPISWPWRVILVGPHPERLLESDPLNLRSN